MTPKFRRQWTGRIASKFLRFTAFSASRDLPAARSPSRRGEDAILKRDESGRGPPGPSKSEAVNAAAKHIIVIDAGNLKPCMTESAIGAIFAEPGEIIRARNFLNVSVPALGPMSAEPARIIRAFVSLFFRVNMAIAALGVGAFAVFRKEKAFRHAPVINGMQVVAQVLLLAQSAQVMFANYQPVVARVPPLASVASRAPVRREEIHTSVRRCPLRRFV